MSSYIRSVRIRSKQHDHSRQLETKDESDHVFEYAFLIAALGSEASRGLMAWKSSSVQRRARQPSSYRLRSKSIDIWT